jgi:CubicO group peptidase (beta-lactamase class C family)
MPVMDGPTANLAAVLSGIAAPFAMAGVGLARPDAPPAFHIATAPGISADEHSLFRAASISKVVTGRVATIVAGKAGLTPPYTVDMSDLLGWRLRNPHHPDLPITLGLVASHAASLSDEGGYQIPLGTPFQDWFAEKGAAPFLTDAPGTRFHYANIGYVLLAAAAEALAGDRFDHLAKRFVLAPLGITAGFNWSGVPASARAHRLPTYRRDGRRLIPQIDERVSADGVSAPDGTNAIPHVYRPGTDVARLSPQGGLRISLAGCLTLAQSIAQDTSTPPLWTPTMGRTDTAGGTFDSYGMGLQYLPAPPFYPRPLIGHFANAYGFAGGIWHDPACGASFAYALNGLPIGDESDDFRSEELAIFAAIATALG